MQPLDRRRSDPAPSRLSYRVQRLMLTPAFRRMLRVGLPFALAFWAGMVWLGDTARQERIALAITDLRQQFETRPEFMVRLLLVEGASATVEAGIRDIFPYALPASSFEIDLDHLRQTIAALPAVADADLRLRRGGVLMAKVRERVPVAVWRAPDGLWLIDREGFRIAAVETRAARPDLPAIAGAGADAAVPEALAVLAAAAPLGARVGGLVRIGERRWDVVLDRDQRILLPEGRPVRALERVIVLSEVQDLLERDVAAVDMRLPDRPSVRMTAHAAEEWWRVTQLMTGTNTQ